MFGPTRSVSAGEKAKFDKKARGDVEGARWRFLRTYHHDYGIVV